MFPQPSTRATNLNTLLLSPEAMEGEGNHSLVAQSEQHHNQESNPNQMITISEVADGLDYNIATQMSTNTVDFPVSVRIGGPSNDIEENNTKMAIVKASMSTLPTDVVMRIFEALPHATAACLGLTCRGLYGCLKKHHPQPILLGSNNGSHSSGFCCDAYFLWWRGQRIYLWQLLKNWMGTKYRFVDFDVSRLEHHKSVMRFLNRKVYSELDGYLLKQVPISCAGEVFLFWSRYQDWADAGLKPKNPIDCRYQKFESRLPNPYNKGHDWFPEAIEAIKADITRFEDIEKWRIFWSSFRVFRNNKIIFDDFFHECILDQLSEGFKLLGL